MVGVKDNAREVASQLEEGEEEELARFLKHPTQPLQSDPLKWWKHNATLFPRLAVVAKTILCVTGTSTPAERMFSADGLVVNHQRAALHPMNVDFILFLNKNMSGLFHSSSKSQSDPELTDLTSSWEDFY